MSTSRQTLEKAVTSALPEGKKAYFFDPLLIWHTNGSCYGVLGGANQALAWQRGLSDRERAWFYLTDADGNRVTIEDNPRHLGHAQAILDKLNAR